MDIAALVIACVDLGCIFAFAISKYIKSKKRIRALEKENAELKAAK